MSKIEKAEMLEMVNTTTVTKIAPVSHPEVVSTLDSLSHCLYIFWMHMARKISVGRSDSSPTVNQSWLTGEGLL